MSVWDWPNQQLVRADHSGPGMNTPPGLPTDVIVTYGHAGLDYEFLLVSTGGDAVSGVVDWEFGDGATADDVPATAPAAHTYAAAGAVTVRAVIGTVSRSATVTVEQ